MRHALWFLIAACGGGAELEEPKPPPDWPIENIRLKPPEIPAEAPAVPVAGSETDGAAPTDGSAPAEPSGDAAEKPAEEVPSDEAPAEEGAAPEAPATPPAAPEDKPPE